MAKVKKRRTTTGLRESKRKSSKLTGVTAKEVERCAKIKEFRDRAPLFGRWQSGRGWFSSHATVARGAERRRQRLRSTWEYWRPRDPVKEVFGEELLDREGNYVDPFVGYSVDHRFHVRVTKGCELCLGSVPSRFRVRTVSGAEDWREYRQFQFKDGRFERVPVTL
jgi:hypothetical protein